MKTGAERIERFLSSRATRLLLGALTRRNGDGQCAMARLMSTYAQPHRPLSVRARYGLWHFLINRLRKSTGASVEGVRDELFGEPIYFRALLNIARSIHEFGLTKPQVFAAPLMVVWNFTQACNFKCKHCYQDAGRRISDELTLEQKLRVVDELAENDVPMLAFSGGEPLVSRDFWPTLLAAATKGFHISVATNGSLLTPETVKRLADCGARYVEVSIDSVDPEKHDEFRGGKGYWQRSIDGLKNLAADGRMRTGLASTITRNNFDELPALVQLTKDLGIDLFYAFNFVPTGRARNIVDTDLTPEMRERMLEIMQEYLEKDALMLMGTAPQLGRRCIQHYALGKVVHTGHYGADRHPATPTIAKYVGGCGAGRCMIAIQPNGDVSPCVFMPLVVGNLLQERLHDIWRNDNTFQTLRNRELLQGHCGQCEWRHYCGGCRARAYGYFKDMTQADPGCIFNRSLWKQLSPSCEPAASGA